MMMSPAFTQKEYDDFQSAENSVRIFIQSPLKVSQLGLKAFLKSLTRDMEIDSLEHLHSQADLVVLDLFSLRQDQVNYRSELQSKQLAQRTLAVVDPVWGRSSFESLFENGIGGVIESQGRREEWKEAVHSLLQGKRWLSRRGRALLSPDPLFSPEPRHPLHSLSKREVQVFQWIGCGKSTRSIAEGLNLSTKTIETYREHIKEKLQLTDAPSLQHAAHHWVEHGSINGKTGRSIPHENAHPVLSTAHGYSHSGYE